MTNTTNTDNVSNDTNNPNVGNDSKVPKYAKREVAQKRIEKELKAKQVSYSSEVLAETLTALYAHCEGTSCVPSKEGFAELCQEEEITSTVIAMDKDPFRTSHTKAIVGGIIAAVILVAGIGAGIAYTVLSQSEEQSDEVVAVEEVAQEGVYAHVVCEGWNAETSTPIVLAIYEGDVKDILLSTDENAEVPTPINEISLNAGEDIKLEDVVDTGTYTLSIVGSPVLEDGIIFEVPDPQVIEYDGEKGQIVTFELSKKDAEDVTEADIAAATAAATAVGADTDKVTNATNNTWNNASSAQGGSILQGQTSNQSKPSGGSTSSGNTGGSTSSGGSSQPSHTHNWVAQTKTVTHPAEYKTVHHDAVTQEVVVCLDCGTQNPSRDHLYQHVISGGNGATTVKTVTVQAAYDEQVLVKNAWTETVTTGYKCSGCGATK